MPPRQQQQPEVQRYQQQVQAELAQARQTHQALLDTASQLQKVSELVSDLPNQLSAPILVPFGKQAFFQGEIRHTNEVTMHLGAGYYVECTAAHAAGVLQRRQQAVERSAAHASKSMQALEDRLQLAGLALPGASGAAADGKALPGLVHDSGDEVVEIRETEQESDALLKSAAASIRQQQPRGTQQQSEGVAGGSQGDLDDVFLRIAELERLEEEAERKEAQQQQQQQQRGQQLSQQQLPQGRDKGDAASGQLAVGGPPASPASGSAPTLTSNQVPGSESGDLLLPQELFMPISVSDVLPNRHAQASPRTQASHEMGRQAVAPGLVRLNLAQQATAGQSASVLPSSMASKGARAQDAGSRAVASGSSSGSAAPLKKGFFNTAPSRQPSRAAGGQGEVAAPSSSTGSGARSSTGGSGASSKAALTGASGQAGMLTSVQSQAPAAKSSAAQAGAQSVAAPSDVAPSPRDAFTGFVVERGEAAGGSLKQEQPGSAGVGASTAGRQAHTTRAPVSSAALHTGVAEVGAGSDADAAPAKRPSKFKQARSHKEGAT